jgi:predicted dithiol-disulfide oxidoreductase (DUF899 family)
MTRNLVVSQAEWTEARKAHLAREKELTRRRDELTRERMALPWTLVEKQYLFDTPHGQKSLKDLFGDRSQLIVYHFMFGPDWEEGCKACSFLADHVNPVTVHLAQRDVSFVAVSRAPLAKLQAFQKRMGWSFRWASAVGDQFNTDFGVYFKDDEAAMRAYNFGTSPTHAGDSHGMSVFKREGDQIFHTYSSYSRGVEQFLGAYVWLDHAPDGRGETGHAPQSFSWLKHHDRYAE